MAGTIDQTAVLLREHRISNFEKLGFPVDEAMTLADARDFDGFGLSHHDVRRYLEAGATQEQVLRIFSPL